MTFEYRDDWGRRLAVSPDADHNDQPVVALWSHGEYGASIPVRVVADRVEELVAGIRDAARTASRHQPERAPAYYGVNGCTCRAWTTVGGVPRYLRGDESVELIGGWDEQPDCPHHAPAVGQPAEAQATDEAEFTDASTAFMQIGQTPALRGLRVELRIEGYPPIVGNYAGAGMRRLEEGVLAIEPLLLFAWANTAADNETVEDETR